MSDVGAKPAVELALSERGSLLRELAALDAALLRAADTMSQYRSLLDSYLVNSIGLRRVTPEQLVNTAIMLPDAETLIRLIWERHRKADRLSQVERIINSPNS
jgi:hypothetical protein